MMTMLKKIFHWPGKNLVLAIPIVLLIGFMVGYQWDTSFLKKYILVATVLMIYPTMIGFKIKEAFDLSHWQVLVTSLLLNFIVIPGIAYILGKTLLTNEPLLFAGLVLASLLPTSGMTISWTMLFKGNVAAAVKITAISLILGSLLAPWYLLVMVGKLIPVNVQQTFITIALVVFLPMLLGNITYRWLMKKYTQQEFQQKIKPIFPSASVWAMLFVIFSSISMKAKMIVENPGLIGQALTVLAVFYLLNFFLSTVVGKLLLKRNDAVALVYGTVMRNLSLSLGLAVTTFGPKAALIVTLAFILQVQGAAWYGKMAEKRQWLGKPQTA
ncbi:Arsenite efflux pump ArsB, ACR3 family [Carboxydocella sporoproducens DSM 16521]|uniref:Arsenite efflux pump ArsB, ACR3 family n=3 Tax=Clostridiales Family XVI. Incertae Sedis TaxID=543347 RepID=A0A1T4NRK4_9FIRM|nr:Arsenite efflux pump ArsB, ACR3 family [Carboxydocella thermautotrophica]SJZ81889.1 Arsenite efflux pump ArsB, ACR3 family [Carboxydocella sporoproducens DSM 16521]